MRDRGDRAKVRASRVTTRTRRVTRMSQQSGKWPPSTPSGRHRRRWHHHGVVRPLPCKKQSACRPASDCNDRDGDLGSHTARGPRADPGPSGGDSGSRGPFDEGEVLRLTRGSLGRAGVAVRGQQNRRLGRRPVSTRFAGHSANRLVSIDPLTGTARSVSRLNGYLTPQTGEPARTIALNMCQLIRTFSGSMRPLSGACPTPRLRDIAGTHHLSFMQTVDGIPLFDNGVQANVARTVG